MKHSIHSFAIVLLTLFAFATSGGVEAQLPQELRRWLENLSDEDLGQYKM